MTQLIYKYKNFYSYYCNAIEVKATLEVPYYDNDPENPDYDTIIVYQSGAITQSGRRPWFMKKVYNWFMGFVMEHRDQIEILTDRYIKYSYKSKPNKLINSTTDLMTSKPFKMN